MRVFFCLLLFIFALSSCMKSALEQEEILYDGPMIISSDVRTLYSENAILKMRLDAALQIVEQSGDVRYPKGVKITSYNREGVIESTLTADSGRFEKATSIYTAMGNVSVTNLLKEQNLKTEKLVWLQNKKEINTDKPVFITTPTEIVQGTGLTTDESFTNYKIWKMSAVFDVEAQNAQRPDTLRNIKEESKPVIGDKRRPLNRQEVKPAENRQIDEEKQKYFEKIKKSTSILHPNHDKN